MKIPRDGNLRLSCYRELLQQCLASRSRRIEQYSQNRRWYLYGSNDGVSPWNKIYSHLDHPAILESREKWGMARRFPDCQD